ncbi:hypothetical protein KIPB_005050 [Kipferlia bialata]|uniref:Cystinosin/ERS1p repeat n=1 Tax=Kipferlia bialata TaxID=797122 RepID=A0A9K3CWN2_9EUKA|nr:hypothetical protein KIPB_005050 [Kipferlia bialata]|eukprot:g5050.t1
MYVECDADGGPYYHLFERLGQCIQVGDLEYLVSFICGLASVGFWMVAQLPQMWKNYRVSGFFFCSIDAVLWYQYQAYKDNDSSDPAIVQEKLYDVVPASPAQSQGEREYGRETQVPGGLLGDSLVLHPLALFICLGAALARASGGSGPSTHTQRLAETEGGGLEIEFWIGYILGWISSINYVLSRTSQIRKNFRDKEPETLSVSMFMLAVCANATYSLSIFLTITSWEDTWPQIPWILGSSGVLGMDITIAAQYFYYTKHNRLAKDLADAVDDEGMGVPHAEGEEEGYERESTGEASGLMGDTAV